MVVKDANEALTEKDGRVKTWREFRSKRSSEVGEDGEAVAQLVTAESVEHGIKEEVDGEVTIIPPT